MIGCHPLEVLSSVHLLSNLQVLVFLHLKALKQVRRRIDRKAFNRISRTRGPPPSGALLGELHGNVVRYRPYAKLLATERADIVDEDTSWHWGTKDSWYTQFATINTTENVMKWTNACSRADEFARMNADVMIVKDRVFYFAAKLIQPGDEILVDYGEGYFASRGMPFEIPVGFAPFEASDESVKNLEATLTRAGFGQSELPMLIETGHIMTNHLEPAVQRWKSGTNGRI